MFYLHAIHDYKLAIKCVGLELVWYSQFPPDATSWSTKKQTQVGARFVSLMNFRGDTLPSPDATQYFADIVSLLMSEVANDHSFLCYIDDSNEMAEIKSMPVSESEVITNLLQLYVQKCDEAKDLQVQVQGSNNQRKLAQEERKLAQEERNQMQEGRNQMQEERNVALAERNIAKEECNTAQVERDIAQGERDMAQKESHDAQNERNAAQNELEALRKAYASVCGKLTEAETKVKNLTKPVSEANYELMKKALSFMNVG